MSRKIQDNKRPQLRPETSLTGENGKGRFYATLVAVRVTTRIRRGETAANESVYATRCCNKAATFFFDTHPRFVVPIIQFFLPPSRFACYDSYVETSVMNNSVIY